MSYIKALTLSIAFAASACASVAHAAVWTEINDPSTSGFSVGANSVTYGPVAASSVWVYNGSNPAGSQSPSAIESLITTTYGLPTTGTSSLTLSSSNDSLSSTKSGSFTIDSSFSYLAIHYGKGELLFHFDQPVAADTVFSFTNLPHGISNYRAYSAVSAVSAVPEPSSYGMLLGGMALIGFVARRKARK